MRCSSLVFFTLAGVAARAAAEPTFHSTDFAPNPAFVPAPAFSVADTGQGKVQQLGDVVILEGDSDLVSDDGQGGYGIIAAGGLFQQGAIANRFYTVYPDEFDELIVLTTFDDNGQAGALAYEMSAVQDVKGIGQKSFDDSATWGSGGTLHAFVDMMRWDQYKQIDGLDVTDPNSGFYSTLGQEFAHRWLSFMHYRDGAGNYSGAMLGRDKAHWASTLQADASVMDGNRFVDHRDGTFTSVETFARYSPLDLYGMGLLTAAEVPPWFLIDNPTRDNGSAVNPAVYLRLGTRVHGVREDITIQQVIAAEGARVPTVANSPHAFRVAFVLLTRPGEPAADVLDIAQQIEMIRKVWEKKFGEYTGGRGTMCTQVSAPCGAATARFVDAKFAEGAGANGNGVVEPGEAVALDFTLQDDGPVAARAVAVKVGSDSVKFGATDATVAEIAPGQSAEVGFSGAIPKGAACGQTITVEVTATESGHTFRGFAQVVPGITDHFSAAFDDDAGYFGANLAAADTAAQNGFAWGTPEEYRGRAGWLFQPSACAGGAGRCWFTGLQPGHRAQTDSSLGVGKASLWSPPIDLKGTYLPTLRYAAWWQAIDFSNPQFGGAVADDVVLTVEGSTDGGQTWIKLDKVDGAVPAWRTREVALKGLIPDGARLLLRFTAENSTDTELVEAGIDAVTIVTQTPACNPKASVAMPGAKPPKLSVGGSGSCAVGRGGPGGAFGAAILALGIALLRRRRTG